MFRSPLMPAVALGVVALPLAAGCVSNAPSGSSGALTVTSTATACTVSSTTAPSGTLTFKVTNAGTDATEFYLLAADGVAVVGEVEDIGPGLTRDMVVQAAPGSYITACKPGMTGDGIRAPFTVTDSGASIAPASGTEEPEESDAS